MLRDPMGKVNNIYQQMGNVTGEMETLRKNQNKMLEIKTQLQ